MKNSQVGALLILIIHFLLSYKYIVWCYSKKAFHYSITSTSIGKQIKYSSVRKKKRERKNRNKTPNNNQFTLKVSMHTRVHLQD